MLQEGILDRFGRWYTDFRYMELDDPKLSQP